MKIPVIKQLVENHSLDELRKAEEAISEEQTPEITIEGADEGEQLTHAYAAVWIMEQMSENQTDFKTELRNYTKKVRTSIS